MAKIIGNTTAIPNPVSDWNQTDENKADYIKNKPDIEGMNEAINQKSQVQIITWEADD